jgi:hypothetical protein
MPRVNHIIMRATPQEVERLEELAKQRGSNKSATLRDALLLLERIERLEATVAEREKTLVA